MSNEHRWWRSDVLLSGLIGALVGGAASLGGTWIATSSAQDQAQHDYQRERRVDGYLSLLDALSELERVVDYQTPRITGEHPEVSPSDFTLDDRASTELWDAARKTTSAYSQTLVFPSGNASLRTTAHELTLYFADVSNRLDRVAKVAAEVRSGTTAQAKLTEAVDQLDARYGYVGTCGEGNSEKCQTDDLRSVPKGLWQVKRDVRDPMDMFIKMRSAIKGETN